MKIILEYKNGASFWKSLSTGMRITDNCHIYDNVFGHYEDRFRPSPYTVYSRNVFPETVSYATLNDLFEFVQDYDQPFEVPVSMRSLKVDLKDVSYLSIPEYEVCIYGTKCTVDYEAILAAAEYLQSQGNEVRLFIFK